MTRPLTMSQIEALRALITDRVGFLRVEVLEREEGCWDIVLRLDGTYFGESFATREQMRAHFEQLVEQALGE